jgi:hypothetical protein
MNPLLRRASRSSVFAFDFFHSRFGSGSGGDIGGAAPAADPAASSRLLFFPLEAFAVLDGDGFILQVHGVFTRIRSGATAVALSGGALDLHFTQRRRRALVLIPGQDVLRMAAAAWGENPKGFGFYL